MQVNMTLCWIIPKRLCQAPGSSGTLLLLAAMVRDDEKLAPNRWSEGSSTRICRRQKPPFSTDLVASSLPTKSR